MHNSLSAAFDSSELTLSSTSLRHHPFQDPAAVAAVGSALRSLAAPLVSCCLLSGASRGRLCQEYRGKPTPRYCPREQMSRCGSYRVARRVPHLPENGNMQRKDEENS